MAQRINKDITIGDVTIEVVAFKTGRSYSENGQRLAVALLPDNRVAFFDVDRFIDGITRIEFGDDAIKEVIPSYDQYLYALNRPSGFAMACYDFGLIDYSVDWDSKKFFEYEFLHAVKNALKDAALEL